MPLADDDTSVTFAPKLAGVGAELLVETLRGLEEQRIVARPQDHSQATLAPILTKEDGLVDFNRTAQEIHNRLRGFQPWPGAYTKFRGKNLKFVTVRPATEKQLEKPDASGTLRSEGDDLFVVCGSGTALQLFIVQPEGKKPMNARDFINGYRPTSGERLG
jgi:methionyl-tRNA formyltransferase